MGLVATPPPPAIIDAPLFNLKGYAIVSYPWKTINGAKVYEIWVDGKPISTQKPTIGPKQYASTIIQCGLTHRWNVRASYGEYNFTTGSYVWGPFGTPRYFTVPAC